MDILLEKSLINCHAMNMDSLVLKEGERAESSGTR